MSDLDEYTKSVLAANRIDASTVEAFNKEERIITFKDGSSKRLCECYTRVMGYIRPTTEYNKGKYSEFITRKNFSENKALEGGNTDEH